jgi:OmcA/MtrC family decaheme c-type cytochrome
MDHKTQIRWLGWAAAGLLVTALSACGGGDNGAAGPEGPAGAPGAAGPAGPTGPSGPSGSTAIKVPANDATPNAAALATWATLEPQVAVTSVTIASPPVINFKITDAAGNPITGLGAASQTSTATLKGLTNMAFSIAKLVPGTNGSPSKWVSYIVTRVPTYKSATDKTVVAATPSGPSTDNTGTLVDNGDGTYKYTFYRDITKIKTDVAAMTVPAGSNVADLGDLTYEPNLVHRLTIQVAGNAPGTGSNRPDGVAVATSVAVPMGKPFDAIYDFIPATGKAVTAADPNRDIVANAKCAECHRVLGGIPGDSAQSSGAAFHGGSRNNVQYCVVCHTEQRRYGATEAAINTGTLTFTSASTSIVDGRSVGNLPNLVHKVHNGKLLAKKGYNFGGVLFNEVGYPQDVRNCTKCHDGSATSTAKTALGDNWKNAPSRLACGACHDGLNFATAQGVSLADANSGLTATAGLHAFAGPQLDDSQCLTCHTGARNDLMHTPVTPPNLASALHVAGGNANTNAAWIASNTSRLPVGAIKVSYDIKSVAVTAGKPVITFRMLQDGVAVPLNDKTAKTEIWDNFMGAPSAYFVFSVPQDGIAAPADFNASASGYLKSIWNGTATGTGAGTITGPDASGYYTVTLTGVNIPSTAKMVTGGVGYSYSVTSTLPLTQTNLTDYPVAAAAITGQTNRSGGLMVITPNAQKVATGYTARRAIVEDARCNACHQELGTFTEDAFHAGQRNDGTTCSWCHNPNRTSSGWSADSTSFVHAIHAGKKRTVPFTWHASSTTESFADIGYPGVLKDCETCHLPGTYDFSATASAAALPNRPYRTVGAGKYDRASSNAVANFSIAPYVVADNVTDYGLGFSFNAGLATSGGVAAGATREAAATTLVNSPITTTCVACHDSTLAVQHMTREGGSIYAPRGTALATYETCMLCHGTDRTADIKAMHAKR